MRIKAKLLLLLIPAIFLVFSLLVGINYYKSSQAAYTHALTLAETTAREYASDMTHKLDSAVTEAETLAATATRLRAQGTQPRLLLNEATAGVATSAHATVAIPSRRVNAARIPIFFSFIVQLPYPYAFAMSDIAWRGRHGPSPAASSN